VRPQGRTEFTAGKEPAIGRSAARVISRPFANV